MGFAMQSFRIVMMNKRWSFLMFLLLLFSVTYPLHPVWAEKDAPVVTRWMSPEEIAKTLHEPLQKFQPLNLQALTPDALRSPVPPEMSLDRICIVVNQNVYANITAALSQYEADLNVMGFDTVTYVYISGTPEDLRAHLTTLYQQTESLVGAVLIGNIPYIIYEMMQNWGNGDEYEDFPCDIFYMDLDGSWSDTLSSGSVQPNNGKYDTRGGDLDLEIWVSRLRTDNLVSLGTESDILNTYFDKNHRYRSGIMVPAPAALVYNDDDWAYMASGDASLLGMIYDSLAITTVSAEEQTTASDYIDDHLTAPYEFISIRSHGSSGGHGFYRNNKATFEYVNSSDYRSIDPEAVFYSLFVCSGADYTVNDILAGTIAFNPDDSGLLSIGSTKTGGMWYENRFYTLLGNGSVYGEAFRQWFNTAQSSLVSAPQWWYGMVLIGDAALMRSNFFVEPCEGDFDGDDNGDDDVDGSDFAVFATDFYRTDCSMDCRGDFDGDGDVDESDLAGFAADFGRTDCP